MKSNHDDRLGNLNRNWHPESEGEETWGDQMYELLSAYVDGEATPAERRQVQQRLDIDRQYKATYLQMMQLRSRLHSIPAPKNTEPAEQLAGAVFNRVERRNSLMVVSGGGAIAALFLAVLASWAPTGGGGTLLAQLNRVESEPLQIALNEPLLPIVNPEAVSLTIDQPLIVIPKGPIAHP